jgi:hypothetical protein
VAHAVEDLPSKLEDLSSKPSTNKNIAAVYWFPGAVVTSDHQLGGLNQHLFGHITGI